MLKSAGYWLFEHRYIIPLAILLCAIGYCGLQKDILGFYHDDGIYVVGAKSLNQGTGYHIISLPGTPPQTKYPIVYPYILSWVWSASPVFPANIAFLKAVNLIFLFLMVLAGYRFYCVCLSKSGSDAYIYAILVGANPGVFSFVDFSVSDLLFVWLVLLACCVSSNDIRRAGDWRAAALALIAALAVLTRSAGVPLALAGLVHFVWARRFRWLAIYGVTLGLGVLPWLAWRFTHKPDVLQSSLLSYYVQYNLGDSAFYLIISQPVQAAQMVWANLQYFFDSLDLVFLLPLFPVLRLRIVVLGLLAIGLYPCARRLSIYVRSFLLFYLILILGWPFHPMRYTLPVIPLLLLFVFRGIHTLEQGGRYLGRGIGPQCLSILLRTPVYLVICLTAAWLASTLQPAHDRWVRGAYGQRLHYAWSGFVETFAWIRNHTRKEDLLATAYDPMYFLYTGRRAILPMLHKPETYFYPYGRAIPDVGSVEEIKTEFRRLKVRYLVTNPLDQYAEAKALETLIPRLLASYPVQPRLVFTSHDQKHKIYEIPSAE